MSVICKGVLLWYLPATSTNVVYTFNDASVTVIFVCLPVPESLHPVGISDPLKSNDKWLHEPALVLLILAIHENVTSLHPEGVVLAFISATAALMSFVVIQRFLIASATVRGAPLKPLRTPIVPFPFNLSSAANPCCWYATAFKSAPGKPVALLSSKSCFSTVNANFPAVTTPDDKYLETTFSAFPAAALLPTVVPPPLLSITVILSSWFCKVLCTAVTESLTLAI